MDSNTILHSLALMRLDGLPAGDLEIYEIQENVFALISAGETLALVKWIADENALGQNELRIGRMFRGMETVPAPPLLFEQAETGGVIAGWAWVQGRDMREAGREHLPAAFTRLGQLHKEMRSCGRVVSPASGISYAGARELLTEEGKRLCARLDPPIRERCMAILAQLEMGYPTLIHGDMHPGNLVVTGDRIWMVDWSYACHSINLFDLDYVQSYSLPAEGPAWSVISPPESLAVLSAYFQAAGLQDLELLKTHQAVMVWNLLRTYENGMKNGFFNEAAQTRERLLVLLQFIGLPG